MPDWTGYVRQRLELTDLSPERRVEIEEELAHQLEDVYRGALAEGRTEAEALALCDEHVPDWDLFSRRVAAEDTARALDPLTRWQQRHEDAWDGRGKAWLTGVRRDVVYSIRSVLKRPLFATVAVLTIALAIAATTSIFSVVNGVLLTDLPFVDPDRLVMIWEHNLPRNRLTNPVSPANFLDWRDAAPAVDSVALLAQSSGTLTGDHDPERVGVMMVSATLFPILGTQPAAGRLFFPEDDVAGAPRTAVLSYGFWQRRYGGDEGIIGRSILLNESSVEVVGVLSPGFDFPMRWSFGGTGTQDVWTTPRWGEEAREATGRWLEVIARLKDGESLGSAQAAMDELSRQLAERRPQAQAGWAINVMPLYDEIVGETRVALIVLFGSVLFVLLIACANVANLMLARAAGRSQEMSVRSALGAGRFRLIRQLMTESLLIAAAGGLLGTVLSLWAVRFLLSMAPDGIPRLENVTLDWRVLLFALTLSLATGVLFGLAPALRTARADLSQALREGATRGGSIRGRGRYALVRGRDRFVSDSAGGRRVAHSSLSRAGRDGSWIRHGAAGDFHSGAG